jgi:hypothetical protein
LRFAQMLANGGVLDGERILAPTSVTLMTSNLLPAGVPMRFLYPFAGVGYGMGVGIVLDPAHADFNGGAIGAGTHYWGGVHGTWFWVDPALRHHRHRHDPAAGRRQSDDRPALPGTRHPCDITVNHLWRADRPHPLGRTVPLPVADRCRNGLGDLQLVVQPKISVAHLLYLLGESHEVPQAASGRVNLDVDVAFAMRWFVEAGEQLLPRGLDRDYQLITANLAVARGKVHPLPTAGQSPQPDRGQPAEP